MAMAEQTAVHQRDAKVVDLILLSQVDSPTLAVATASLQFNSQVQYEATEQLRRAMKIMLDAQMLRDNLAASQRTGELMVQQIATQNMLTVSNEKQARASNFLARVNIFLALVAAVLAAVQAYIAFKQWRP